MPADMALQIILQQRKLDIISIISANLQSKDCKYTLELK
jgi:hypothetical protein